MYMMEHLMYFDFWVKLQARDSMDILQPFLQGGENKHFDAKS